MGSSSAFSYSASRYSYSKTPESIQVDHLFREAGTPGFGPYVNGISILLFEYEYRFTEYEYEYEKNLRYELPATIMPDGPLLQRALCQVFQLRVGLRSGAILLEVLGDPLDELLGFDGRFDRDRADFIDTI